MKYAILTMAFLGMTLYARADQHIDRLTVGSQTLTSSVNVMEDIWMRPQ